jgi:hypothetical protein
MNRPKNIAASVRQRLYELSKHQGLDLDAVLVRFAVERILARLSKSKYANRFVLKGAMLFAVWGEFAHRPTRDMDLLGFGETDVEEITKVFKDILSIPVEDDGLIFDPNNITAAPIRALDGYGGLAVKFQAKLDSARIAMQIDIGVGDIVVPAPEEVTFPNLLPDFQAPRIRAYPVYTAFAEKIEAAVSLGDQNTRMKDFFDMWFMSHKFELDPNALRTAIESTFARRKTALPTDRVPHPLTPEFAALQEPQWKQFLARNHMPEPAGSFAELLTKLSTLWRRIFSKA